MTFLTSLQQIARGIGHVSRHLADAERRASSS
jgi:hypothetical protein